MLLCPLEVAEPGGVEVGGAGTYYFGRQTSSPNFQSSDSSSRVEKESLLTASWWSLPWLCADVSGHEGQGRPS